MIASAWVLTDGKAGDEGQCIGIVERLGIAPQIRRVAPRRPFSWAMPWGPVDPAEAPSRPGSPIAPPWPDLAVASGRRAVPYLREVRRLSAGRTFTVFLKDPRTGAGAADLIWVPEHDRLRAANVIATLTSPHRLSPAILAAARAGSDPRLAAIRRPRAAVLVGGPSRQARFSEADAARLRDGLAELAAGGAGLMVTASRRTPPTLRAMLEELLVRTGGFLWDGTGANPIVAMLARADAIVVTADSVNMVSEAVATGAPVLVFDLPGLAAKHRGFVAALERYGAVRPFRGRLEPFSYEPLDSTPVIADAIAEGLRRHRDRLGLA